jgi:signal transduction histidine kinase
MILRTAWHRTALGLGIGWSLLWSLVLWDLPFNQQLDLCLHDRLIRLTQPRTPPPAIFLVTITQTDLTDWGNTTQPAIYSTLVDRLLKGGATGVVINLLPNWVQTADHANNPIKTLIQNHSDRIVLVLPTSSATQLNPIEWRSYQYFLPTDNNGEPILPPQSILGFAEYEPEVKDPQSLQSSARQANLTGRFNYTRNPNGLLSLDSFALLSLKKFQPQKQVLHFPKTPIQIRFWGAVGTFPTLNAQAILGDRSPPLNLRNKIILVGFSDTQTPDTFAVQSPFGDIMPAVEWQANVLASLMTQSYARTIPFWLQSIITLTGSILLSGWIVWGTVPSNRIGWRYWGLPILLLSSLLLLGGGLFWQRWILPITLPALVWCATGLSVFFSLRLGRQRELISQQQCEIDRLQSVEQAAVISQAHKLIHRLASDIHDGPLQELKLIMDRLELLQMQSPQLPIDPILDQLSSLGTHLREHLSQTRAIALSITPELRDGLAHGIQTRLTQLTQSGELTLQVIQHLNPLEEPTLNSLWLEAREDIYRFFNEAIHNVICHAQPPHGIATQVIISLEQQNAHCTLSIENDGAPLDPAVFEPTPQQRQRGGYGTKLMDTIAAELPDGSLQRIPLVTGGLLLKLTWNQGFMMSRSIHT